MTDPHPQDRGNRSGVALGWLGFALALAAVVALGLSGIGSRNGWWQFRTGFTVLRWAAYGGIAAAVLSLAGLLVLRLRLGWVALLPAIAGLLLGMTAAFIPWRWLRIARSVPPIHDITTDTKDPPEFVAILPLRKNAPNPATYEGEDIARQQAGAYPDVVPLLLDAPADLAFKRALDAAHSMGWKIVGADSASRLIEATDRTPWFGFYDDVVVRIREAGGQSRIDVRSVSRVGRSDVGTNARRIRTFLDRIRSR